MVAVSKVEELAISKIEIGDNYLEVTEQLTAEEFCDRFATLKMIAEGSQWWLGDLYAYGEDYIGEESSQAVEVSVLKWSDNSILRYQRVCRRIPKEHRRVELSFGHHMAIADAFGEGPLDLIDQWLNRSVLDQLSIRRLKAAIKEAKESNDCQIVEGTVVENVEKARRRPLVDEANPQSDQTPDVIPFELKSSELTDPSPQHFAPVEDWLDESHSDERRDRVQSLHDLLANWPDDEIDIAIDIVNNRVQSVADPDDDEADQHVIEKPKSRQQRYFEQLVDGWNSIAEECQLPKVEIRDPPTRSWENALKKHKQMWKDRRLRVHLEDVGAIVLKLKNATFVHGTAWASLSAMLSGNSNGEMKIEVLMRDGYERQQTNKPNSQRGHDTGPSTVYDPNHDYAGGLGKYS